jgi:hypothetical protein
MPSPSLFLIITFYILTLELNFKSSFLAILCNYEITTFYQLDTITDYAFLGTLTLFEIFLLANSKDIIVNTPHSTTHP